MTSSNYSCCNVGKTMSQTSHDWEWYTYHLILLQIWWFGGWCKWHCFTPTLRRLGSSVTWSGDQMRPWNGELGVTLGWPDPLIFVQQMVSYDKLQLFKSQHVGKTMFSTGPCCWWFSWRWTCASSKNPPGCSPHRPALLRVCTLVLWLWLHRVEDRWTWGRVESQSSVAGWIFDHLGRSGWWFQRGKTTRPLIVRSHVFMVKIT